MKRIKKYIFFLMIVLNIMIISGCWNYTEINEVAIAVGAAVDYDKKEDQIILTVEVVYPTIEAGETKMKPGIITSKGKNFFDAIRNTVSKEGKKLFWAHAKLIIISKEIANNQELLISLMDFIKRDAEYRDDMWIVLSREKTAREILKTDVLIQDIVSFHLEDILKNEQPISKYNAVPLWKFVDDLSAEGISPTLPTARIRNYKNKKIAEVYGTAVFKGAKVMGWLNGDETKSLLFIIDKIKGGVIVVEQKMSTRPVKIALEIFENKTKTEAVYENEDLTMKIHIKTTVNINELDSQVDFISKNEIVKKNAEKLIENKVKKVIRKVQKEYNSDIFGFAGVIERQNPDLWKAIKPNWDNVFKNLNIEVNVEMNIRGSALRSKPIKVRR